VDQYIEIVNKYPDDESLVREAALYAASHARAHNDRLLRQDGKILRRIIAGRMTLARIQASLEIFRKPSPSTARRRMWRPDRVDLFYRSRFGWKNGYCASTMQRHICQTLPS